MLQTSTLFSVEIGFSECKREASVYIAHVLALRHIKWGSSPWDDGNKLSFCSLCPHRILVGPWPEELVSWCQQAALLPLTLSPACSDNKIFPCCWLSLDQCAGFRSGAANKGWGSLATSHQGELRAVTSDCTTARLHRLPAALHARTGLQGLIICTP